MLLLLVGRTARLALSRCEVASIDSADNSPAEIMNYGNYIKKVRLTRQPYRIDADEVEHGRAVPNWRRWQAGCRRGTLITRKELTAVLWFRRR